jgi:hypothetical protein
LGLMLGFAVWEAVMKGKIKLERAKYIRGQ